MPNLKMAKCSAALEAIKQLHACGELSDRLKPIKSDKCIELYAELYFKSWKEFKYGNEILWRFVRADLLKQLCF